MRTALSRNRIQVCELVGALFLERRVLGSE
jgi:hypothetical protein